MARQGLFEASNVTLSVTKWGLIVFNVAFWCLGVVSLAIGLWLYTTSNEYATFSEGSDLVGSVFLIAVGFGVVIVGFLGIVAAIWESVIISTAFATLVLLASGMYLTSGIWSFVQRGSITEDVRRELDASGQRYETSMAHAAVWDSLHIRFNCCGVVNYTDWMDFLSVPPERIPWSCCPNEPEDDQSGCQAFVMQGPLPGCLDSLVDYEQRQYDIMGPIGLAFGSFQIFGVFLCICFCVSVRSTKQSYAPR